MAEFRLPSRRARRKVNVWRRNINTKTAISRLGIRCQWATLAAVVSALVSVISVFVTVLILLSSNNWIDLKHKEHVLMINVVNADVVDDLVYYTLLIRNDGDYVEDIVDIGSYLDVNHKDDKYSAFLNQDYCFKPFSLKSGEHRMLEFVTRYDLSKNKDIFKFSESYIIPNISCSIAGDAGWSTKYIPVGIMYEQHIGYKFEFKSVAQRVLFEEWKPLIILTSFPRDPQYRRNRLCSELPACGVEN